MYYNYNPHRISFLKGGSSVNADLTEEEAMARAMALSMNPGDAGPPAVLTEEQLRNIILARDLTEEQAMKMAMALSMNPGDAGPPPRKFQRRGT